MTLLPPAQVAQRIGEWPVRHSRATFWVLVVLGVLGVVVGTRIPLDRLRQPAAPMLHVDAGLPGIDAATVENLVTKPLEHALTTLPGLRDIESHSREGGADIFLLFARDVDRDRALARVRTLVEPRAAGLPTGMNAPTVSFDLARLAPAAVYVVSAPALSDDLVRWTRNVLADPLRELPEVASIAIKGIHHREVLIQPDPRRVAALGLSFDDLIDAVRRRGVARSRQSAARQVVAVPGSVEAIAARPVRLPNGEPIALAEVASVSMVSHAAVEEAHHNSASALRIIIYPRSRSDARHVANRSHAHVAWLRANDLVPAGAHIRTLHDESRALVSWLKRVLFLVGVCLIFIFAVVAALYGAQVSLSSMLAFAVWSAVAVAVLGELGQALTVSTVAGLMLVAAPFCLMLVSRLEAEDLRRVAIIGALAWVAGLTFAANAQISVAFAAGLVVAALVRWLMTPWLRIGLAAGAPHDETPVRWFARRPIAVRILAFVILIAVGACAYALSAVGAHKDVGTFSFRLRGDDPQQLHAIVDPMMVSLHVIAHVQDIVSSTQQQETWRLQLDPQRMDAVGVDIAAVGRALAIAREGLVVGQIAQGDEHLALRMRLAPGAAGVAFDHLLLRGESNKQPAIYLHHVGIARKELMARERVRVDGKPALKITATWRGADAREALQDFCGRVEVPRGYYLDCTVRNSPI